MTFLGIPAEKWFMAIAYIVGGFLVGIVASWIFKNIFRRIFAKTKTRLDDILLAAVAKPIVAIIVFIGIRMGIDVLTLDPGVAPWVDKAITILIAGAVAWAFAKLLDGLMEEYLVPYVRKTEGDLDDQLLPILRKAASIGAILAGLGIGGVAIALAAKDTLSNFFGSVAVFVDRPFKLNDRVKVAGFDGYIVEIGIRTSRLKTLDNRIVTLPNSLFTAGAIENVSSEPAAKVAKVIQLDTAVGYEGTLRAIAILREIGESAPGIAPGTVVSLMDFGESSFDVTFIFFIAKDADYFGTINAVNLEVLRRLEEAKLPLAFPTRVIVERKGS